MIQKLRARWTFFLASFGRTKIVVSNSGTIGIMNIRWSPFYTRNDNEIVQIMVNSIIGCFKQLMIEHVACREYRCKIYNFCEKVIIALEEIANDYKKEIMGEDGDKPQVEVRE